MAWLHSKSITIDETLCGTADATWYWGRANTTGAVTGVVSARRKI